MIIFEYVLWHRIPFSEIIISLEFLKAIFRKIRMKNYKVWEKNEPNRIEVDGSKHDRSIRSICTSYASRFLSMIFIDHFIDPYCHTRCSYIACAGNIHLNRSWEGRIPRSVALRSDLVTDLSLYFTMPRSAYVIE